MGTLWQSETLELPDTDSDNSDIQSSADDYRTRILVASIRAVVQKSADTGTANIATGIGSRKKYSVTLKATV